MRGDRLSVSSFWLSHRQTLHPDRGKDTYPLLFLPVTNHHSYLAKPSTLGFRWGTALPDAVTGSALGHGERFLLNPGTDLRTLEELGELLPNYHQSQPSGVATRGL